ncbi:unnamed protein product [Rhizoctonia solani]|uniref:Uncharacterized protein n=1 Tax=Rhizoctonia solani TaxID=456999 RepID=A0A8H3GH57_9AGAM|nr:unnamed protein product [Rhizoctonia solani]
MPIPTHMSTRVVTVLSTSVDTSGLPLLPALALVPTLSFMKALISPKSWEPTTTHTANPLASRLPLLTLLMLSTTPITMRSSLSMPKVNRSLVL